jgi:hypothetical protein
LIWPGLAASAVIFGIYLFDCAWDTESGSLSVPISVFVLNIAVFLVLFVLFFIKKYSLDSELDARVSSMIESHHESCKSSGAAIDLILVNKSPLQTTVEQDLSVNA